MGLHSSAMFAQTIFNYTNLTSGVGITAPNASSTAITRGTPDILQATDCMSDQGFGSHGWPTTNSFVVSTFNSNGWYVEFTITPDAGFGLKITGFEARSRRENLSGSNNDGPRAIRYAYSTNGVDWSNNTNPGNPQSSNICASSGVKRVWPGFLQVNTSDPVTFRIYGLSSGAAGTGDLFLHDVKVFGEVCDGSPEITLDAIPDICFDADNISQAVLDYSNANIGDFVSVDFADPNISDKPSTLLTAASGSLSFDVAAGTTPGTYAGTLTVRNTCGFETDYPISVTVNALPDVTILLSETEICVGGFVTLMFTDDASTGHLFSITADLEDDNGVTVGAINYSNIPDGAFDVYTEGEDFFRVSGGIVTLSNILVTDESTGCEIALDDLTLTVIAPPIPAILVEESSGIAGDDGIICPGALVELTASGGDTYRWSTGATTANITDSPGTTTTYTVTVTSSDGCTASLSQEIIVSPLPVPSISVVETSGNTEDDGTICIGASATLTASGGSTYLWSTGAMTAAILVSPVTTSTYTVTVTNAAACTATASQTIIVNPLPTPGITVEEASGAAEDDGTICTGDMATLTASGGDSYLWSTAATTTAIVVSPVESTTYIVTVTDAEGCEATTSQTITVDPLPDVSITADDDAICNNDDITLTITDNAASGHTFSIDGDLVDDNGTTPLSYTGVPSGTIVTYTEGVDFEGSTGGSVSLENIVITDETTGCSYEHPDIMITVNPLPDALVSISPSDICPGEMIEIFFNESNYDPGTEFSLMADVTDVNGTTSVGPIPEVIDGDHLDWTEGVEFSGDLSIFNIVVTEPISGCSATIEVGPTLNVYDAPEFGFTAASDGDGPDSGNNGAGPNTLDIDFCVGDNLTLSAYTDNGLIGYTASYTTSGNISVNGGAPLPLSSGPSNVAPASAASFFDATYGGALGYGLSSGISGTINQTFVPYLDNDASGTFTSGDCEGAPMYLNYNIYAIPTVTVMPSDATVCNGETVEFAFTGNIPTATYSWTNDNTEIGLAASGDGDISFTATNLGLVDIVANLLVTPSANGCDGTPVAFTVTVHPEPIVSVTATVESGDPQMGSNAGGPVTIDLDFCEGQSFTFSDFMAPAGVGFLEEIVDGTTNLLYGVTPILPIPRPQTNIPAAGAAAFFAGTYGTYSLASGTYGWMDEVFTPYYDANSNGAYDPLIDCLGAPITVHFAIYGAISVNVTRNNSGSVCSGDQLDYSVTTTSTENVVFDLVLETTTNGGNPADLTDDNTLPMTITGLVINDVTPYNLLQVINNAVGTFDRGRVRVKATNIHYEDVDVCGPTADDNGPYTMVYPKPILTDPADEEILSGNTVTLNFDPLSGTPSINANTAGYPIRVDWTAVATGGVTGFTASGSAEIFDEDGLYLMDPVMETLSLPAASCIGTVTYTFTPVADGPSPGGAYDANVCTGDPFDVVVTVKHSLLLTSAVVGSSQVACGDEVTINVTSAGFCDINSMDYQFNWDPALFELVTLSTPYPPTFGFWGLANGVSDIYLNFIVFAPPFGEDIPDGTVILSYTLRAIGPAGVYDVPQAILLEDAFNSNFEEVDMSTTGVSIEIVPLSLMSVGPNPVACPGDPFVSLPIGGVVGNPNHYFIDFDGCPGFPDTQEGAFDPGDGEIQIQLLPGLMSGACNATLVVSNTQTGCESETYNFSIIIDQEPPMVPTPGPITQQCFPEPAPDIAVVVGATDNCTEDLDLVIGFVEDTDNGGSGCSGDPLVISRVYAVTDEAGNTTYVTQTISIEDDTDPELDEDPVLPAAWYQTIEEAVDSAVAHANAHKMDNCTPPAAISVMVDDFAAGPCENTIPIILTDACGNVNIVYYNTIIDSEPPTIENPGPLDDCYDESEDDQSPYYPYQYPIEEALAAVAAVANDDCTDPEDLIITATHNDTPCDFVIVVTVTDACGKETEYTYSTRVENDPPTIFSNPGDLAGFCFETEQEAIDAAIANTDAQDDCLGVLQYDAFVSGGCPYEVMVVVTDFCGNSAEIIYTDVYIDDEVPTVDPLIEVTCFKTLEEAAAYLAVAANPDDNCTSAAILIASALETPVFTPDMTDPCSIGTVTLTFTDICLHFIEVDFENITIDPEAPTLVSLPPMDPQYFCLSEVPFGDPDAVVADDNCGDVVVTWDELEDVLPTDCPGVLVRTYHLTDCAGNVTDVTQTFNVNDDVAPTWLTADGDLDLAPQCGTNDIDFALSLEPEAEDNCGEVTIELVSLVVLDDCTGSIVRTWRAFDDCGNSSTALFTQTITIVDNIAPNWLNPVGELDTEVECDDADGLAIALLLEPVADDDCGDVTLVKTGPTYIEYEGCTYGYIGKWVTEWVAVDVCENESVVFTQTIDVYDATGPTWVTVEGTFYPEGLDASISCDDVAEYDLINGLVPTAEDNCGGVEIIKTQGTFVAGGDCPQEGTVTNTFIAYDNCGNSSNVFTQVITIKDEEPPTFDPGCQALPLALFTEDGYDCPMEAELLGLAVDDIIDINTTWNVAGFDVPDLSGCVFDNCATAESIIIRVVSIEVVDEDCQRNITVSFQLEDPCGNIQPTLFVCEYHIIDNTDPVIFCPQFRGGPVIGDCYTSVAAAEADALEAISPCDNCTEEADLLIAVATVGTCDAAVTVTVTDCAGNFSTHTFYTRIDEVDPVLVAGPTLNCFATVNAAEIAAIAATDISDNCSDYEDLDIVAVTTGTCPATVTITATDECGNSSSVSYPGLCIGAGSSVMITVAASNDTVDCSNEAAGLAAWLADNGGAEATGSGISWTYAPNPIEFGAPDCMTHLKSVEVTFTATDNCGYTDQTTATFYVEDVTPPVVPAIPDTDLTCDSSIPDPDLNLVVGATDDCDALLSIALASNSSNMGTGCPGDPLILLRTYSVTDDYCNTTYVTHTIVIVDDVAPTFTAPANITISVDASCFYNANTAITGDVTDEADNCSSGLNAVYTDVQTPGIDNPDKIIISRTWTLIDDCGNTAIPLTQIITVQDITPPTINCPDAVLMPGAPIEGEQCAWWASGLTPTFDDNCSGASLSYELEGFYSGSSSGIGSVDGRLFLEGETTVTYTVTDGVGNTTTCSFVVTVNCTTISGTIVWEHNHSLGVKDATVRLTLGMMNLGSTLSDINGDYSLSVNTIGVHTITPVKNINRFNGVDMADVTAIQQHVLGINLITDPYKKVAADVNRSGLITSQDASVIAQALAGNPIALAIFNVFWRFTPTTYVMPLTAPPVVPAFPENITVNVTGLDIIDQDFYGMKIGDVNGTANPAVAPTGAPLVWMLKDQTLVPGAEIELDFNATNFNALAAVQFALDFDPSYLQFTGYQSHDAIPLTADNFGAFNAVLGEFRFVWAQAQGLSLLDGTPVMKLKFKVLQGGQKLSQVLQLDNSVLACKAYTETFVPSDVRIQFVESVSAHDPSGVSKAQLSLFQNQPNPFAGETTIGFVLPEACEAQLRIMDVSGRELTHYKRTYTAGYHEIEFRMENASAYGMLYYELITPYGSLTKKMLTTGK